MQEGGAQLLWLCCYSAPSVSAAELATAHAGDVRPVRRVRNKRRRQKRRSPVSDDDSSGVSVEHVADSAAVRCLRSRDNIASEERAQKCHTSPPPDDDTDDDYEIDNVSRPKRRKRRRR